MLVAELGVLYAAFSAGRPSPLPALPIQYADYAEWQREWLQGDVLQAEIAFWKEKLGGPPPPVLELPGDRPRPPSRRRTAPPNTPGSRARSATASTRSAGRRARPSS